VQIETYEPPQRDWVPDQVRDDVLGERRYLGVTDVKLLRSWSYRRILAAEYMGKWAQSFPR